MLPFALAVAEVVATRVERTSGVISTHFKDGGHESEDNNHFYRESLKNASQVV